MPRLLLLALLLVACAPSTAPRDLSPPAPPVAQTPPPAPEPVPASPAVLNVSPSSLTLHRGASGALEASEPGVRWESSDPGLARVDQEGHFVTGARPGEVTLTAISADGRRASALLTVLDRWMTLYQARRAVTDDCEVWLGARPNTSVVLEARLQGTCPAAVPVQVVRGDGELLAQGVATPAAPFAYAFPPQGGAVVYVQVAHYGAFGAWTGRAEWTVPETP